MTNPTYKYEEVSAEEVQRRLEAGEKLNIVDIREPFEWQATGVIPGARLSAMRPFLLNQLDSIDKDEEVILVCATGVRTVDAAIYMQMKGFKQPKSMAGGMKVWQGPKIPSGQ
jgi:rhodanese-related sulfurtransferase